MRSKATIGLLVEFTRIASATGHHLRVTTNASLQRSMAAPEGNYPQPLQVLDIYNRIAISLSDIARIPCTYRCTSGTLSVDSRWPAPAEGARSNALEGFTVEQCLLESDVTKTVVLLGRYNAQSSNIIFERSPISERSPIFEISPWTQLHVTLVQCCDCLAYEVLTAGTC